MRNLSINGIESEVIPGCALVAMLRREAEKQRKPVTVLEAKPEGRATTIINKIGLGLAGCLGIYVIIHVLVALVRS